MKKLIVLSMMIGSLGAVASEINVKVSGMVCSMCAQGIQKKFSNETSIKKLHVDMDEKVVHIETKEGAELSDETIKKLISEAGYNVSEIKRQ